MAIRIAALVFTFLSMSGAQADVTFSLPLDCAAHDCFLQNYVDVSRGEGRDAYCKRATYPGHKGTDFRVRNLVDLKKGILVRAMADGRVLRFRNSQPDRLITSIRDRHYVKGKECGNGIVIDHGNGWISQTCHLLRGSISVKAGDRVKRGQPIARMGLSGLTEFPHVHVSIRKNQKLMDPLTGHIQPETCVTPGPLPNTTLWDGPAQAFLSKGATALLQQGFANGPVDVDGTLLGNVRLPGRSGPIIFYAKFINLEEGDEIELELRDRFSKFASHRTKPSKRSRASWMSFVGRKSGVPPGTKLTGRAKLYRKGRLMISGDPVELRF